MDMESVEAREHLEMVERIVAASSRRLCAGGEYFLVWGLVAAGMDCVAQLILSRVLPSSALFVWGGLLAFGIVFTVVRTRSISARAERMPILQREFLNVLWITIGIAVVCDVVGFRLFPDWGGAAIWNVVAAIVLFYIGMHGNRRAIVGGIIAIVSFAAANFVLNGTGFVLAAGMLFGYGGFGLAEMLSRD
jgi:hypothetical protein